MQKISIAKINGKIVRTVTELPDESIVDVGLPQSLAGEVEAAAKKKGVTPYRFIDTAIRAALGYKFI